MTDASTDVFARTAWRLVGAIAVVGRARYEGGDGSLDSSSSHFDLRMPDIVVRALWGL